MCIQFPCVCMCVPASTRLSEGRTLPQYWDTPVHHSRPQHIDGPREDKHRLRPCWCSWGPLLSTRLSEGRTCGQTYNTITTEQHHGLNVLQVFLWTGPFDVFVIIGNFKKKKEMFNEELFVIFVPQLKHKKGLFKRRKKARFLRNLNICALYDPLVSTLSFNSIQEEKQVHFKKVKLLLLRQKDALASQSLYVY